MIGIYKITNQINGKIYIGQSTDILRRWREEKYRAFVSSSSEYNTTKSKAFRKYGLENFTFEVLCECLNEELDKKEMYYINYYNSTNPEKGYNTTDGGYSPHTQNLATLECVQQIIFDLKNTSLTGIELGQKYGVSDQLISDINCGRTWIQANETYPIRVRSKKMPRCQCCGKEITYGSKYCTDCMHITRQKCERPEPKQLAQEIIESSFCAVGRKYGVSDNAIRKWCVAYGMPKTKQELQKWLEEN